MVSLRLRSVELRLALDIDSLARSAKSTASPRSPFALQLQVESKLSIFVLVNSGEKSPTDFFRRGIARQKWGGAPLRCRSMVSSSISPASPAYFSSFPHGTGSLSEILSI